jgi:hypothetical protein
MSESDEAWRPLHVELDAWTAAGLVATLWWRDDDAIAPTAALDRMLALVNRYRVPLGLAVIPASAKPALATRLSQETLVEVLQHGLMHKNHANPGERAAEFGAQRALDVRLADVSEGARLVAGFPRRTPIFVPPWNRYDVDLSIGLWQQRFVAVSAFGPAKQLFSTLVECNCHVDIISWRTTRGFAGVDKTVRKLTDQLRARRGSAVALRETTGVLSHHLVHDEGCWQFLDALFARLDGHPAVRWIGPLEATRGASAS